MIDEETNHLLDAAKISALLKEKDIRASVEFVRELMRESGVLNQNHPCQNDTSGFGFIRFSEFCFLFFGCFDLNVTLSFIKEWR